MADLFLYSGKNRPGLYLDEKVRKGISSFADLANVPELNTGLKMLKDDIESGRFETVRSGFEDLLGDYLFVVLEKAIN